jgi:hypothetical protein
LQGYQADVVRTTEAVNDLERAAKQVLESQALLQAAVASLGDSQLSGVLTRLDASIQELKPVMTNLSQPFVLQAVPVKPNHG